MAKGKFKAELLRAAEEGNLSKMIACLDKGADINAKLNQYGLTALYQLSLGNHYSCAELAIARGADVNIENYLGVRPLHVAAVNGYYRLAELLIERGADVFAKDFSGRTAVSMATGANNHGIAELVSECIRAHEEHACLNAMINRGDAAREIIKF